MLVTFRDIRDPATVELVDPANLAAAFGQGYRLKRIVAAVTDDRVTSGIEKRLPQPSTKGFFNWDGKSNPNDVRVLSIVDFTKR